MNVMAKRDAPVRPDLNNPELNNLAMSKEASWSWTGLAMAMSRAR